MLNAPSTAFNEINAQKFDSENFTEQTTHLAPPLLLQYWQLVLRWKWPILGVILGALIVGIILTLLTTPKYTAASRIEISREQKNVTKVASLDSPDAGRDLEFYQTQYSLLQARSLAERVSRDLHLGSNQAFFRAHGINGRSNNLFSNNTNALTGVEQQKQEQNAIALLLKNINVSPVRGSSLIDVSYTSTSPELSAQIANSWTQQFIEASMDRRYASTADARKFLEGRLADLRTRLEESEREAVEYASNKGIVTLAKNESADGKTHTERTLISSDLEALNDALTKATADRIAAESRAHTSSANGTSTQALSNTAISALRQKRAEVAAEYAKMLVQFEPDYPAARALNQQIRTLDTSISREESRVVSSRSGEYSEALSRENNLRHQVGALKVRLDTQQRDSIQYNIYQREADTNRQLYDSLLQRFKEIGIAGVGTNNIAIVDSAKIPTIPSSPNLPLNLALALLAGLGLAAATVFALDQIDEGLREPNQINRLLQIPLLGSVPNVEHEEARELLKDAKSNVSEAYLSIRSNLAFSTDHGVPRTMMVTSTRQAEGKSTTSLALATVLGRTGKRVLLIDSDMRKPALHKLVNSTNSDGLSNFLAGDNEWQRLVVVTPMKGVSIISAGPLPPSAAELLSSDRISILIKNALEHFDHIIIDSPPILGLADAPLLSRVVEGCVFVIEAEGVALRGIKAALGRLQSAHAHVFGAVLTKLRRRQSGYAYDYADGYSYGDDTKK
jgi:capsular exopolysaccharide synthesis family protein